MEDVTRSFSGADRVVFDGQAGTHLGLHVAAWEADQSSSAWYEKLFDVLQEVVDGLHITDVLNNFNPTSASPPRARRRPPAKAGSPPGIPPAQNAAIRRC
ncbi:hypothetical protein Sgleb_73480 [Streptomyces glebosus]|uniref:Uncharacterized protein n=1 Tax=Streptomyces glebosus TaxID=249580 RepID=A0A640T9Y8_9ACTN|nr:hypothetical protein [Streptomyces glebosus]GFE19301.1 hypothetical protein Sgleb_73480 [Streptomyces glebosus]GHG79203.1 hypothetical protein GCM10010513_56360 [Streptomyces glebosus]